MFETTTWGKGDVEFKSLWIGKWALLYVLYWRANEDI